jgi:nucleotide-binding universal stress UspA family protein
MSTATEFMSRCTAPNLAEPVPRTTSKPELGEIVVFTDNRSDAPNILEFAGLLAEENGARLISVFTLPAPAVTLPQEFARGTGIREVIETHQSQLDSIEGRQRARFDDVVRRHRIPQPEWRSLSQWSTEVAVQAYYADVVVIARPEPAGQVPGPSGLAESLVLSSGRPIILFPPRGTASRVRRILIGWNATREAIRAVADAVPLLARADAVKVLIVDYQRQRARHGQEPGAEIARRLAALGARVEVQRLSSGGQDVGHLLLSQAVAFRADLLVMGAYGHSTLREWFFGGVTRTVLYQAGLPVLMSR